MDMESVRGKQEEGHSVQLVHQPLEFIIHKTFKQPQRWLQCILMTANEYDYIIV